MLLRDLQLSDSLKKINHQIDIDYFGEIYSFQHTLLSKIKNILDSLKLQQYSHIELEYNQLVVRISIGEQLLIVKFIKECSTKHMPLSAGLDLWKGVCSYASQTEEKMNKEISHVAILIKKEFQKFSSDEIENIKMLNPKVWKIENSFEIKEKNFHDITFIMREHLLLEKFNLLNSLLNMGLSASNCWIITKEDKTTYFNKVYNS
ncbi:hypothetical protein V7192_19060, partial [Bacillus safensis]